MRCIDLGPLFGRSLLSRRAAVRHAPGIERARKKQSERKSAVCSQRAQALPVVQELEIGPFQLFRHSMRPSAIRRAPCIERARKKRSKRKSAAYSQRARGRASHGQSPLGSTRARSPIPGLSSPLWDSTRARGVITRDVGTVDLPPPAPRGRQERAPRGNGRHMAEPACTHRRRRKPGRGWALRVFIKTPAPLPRPSVPTDHGTGPATLCVPHPFRFSYRDWTRLDPHFMHCCGPTLGLSQHCVLARGAAASAEALAGPESRGQHQSRVSPRELDPSTA